MKRLTVIFTAVAVVAAYTLHLNADCNVIEPNGDCCTDFPLSTPACTQVVCQETRDAMCIIPYSHDTGWELCDEYVIDQTKEILVFQQVVDVNSGEVVDCGIPAILVSTIDYTCVDAMVDGEVCFPPFS